MYSLNEMNFQKTLKTEILRSNMKNTILGTA